jgi:hypothetical protein
LPSQSNDAATASGEESNNTQRDQIFPSNTIPNITTRKRKKGSKKSRAIEVNFEEKDLRGIVARGQASTPQVDPYRSLLAAGYIKDSTEFLSKD